MELNGTKSPLSNGEVNLLNETTVKRYHCHRLYADPEPKVKAKRKLLIALILCLLVMLGEIIGGALSSSLAIMTDAAHLLSDVASFLISLLSLYLASSPATKRMNFGWHRAEVVGALVSVLLIWLVTGVLVYLAIERIVRGDYEIDAKVMLITAGLGVAFNILILLTLHEGKHGHSHHGVKGHCHEHDEARCNGHVDDSVSNLNGAPPDPTSKRLSYGSLASDPSPASKTRHASESSLGCSSRHGMLQRIASESSLVPDRSLVPSQRLASASYDTGTHSPLRYLSREASVTHLHEAKGNINVRAAFIHALGDLIQSVGILLAAIVIFFKPEWKLVDPICTFIFSVLVLFTTFQILKDVMIVLMEGAPSDVRFTEVADSLRGLRGVADVHDLRLWSLTMDRIALSVHLAIDTLVVRPAEVLDDANHMLAKRFGISEMTIQVESYVEEMRNCARCQHLRD